MHIKCIDGDKQFSSMSQIPVDVSISLVHSPTKPNTGSTSAELDNMLVDELNVNEFILDEGVSPLTAISFPSSATFPSLQLLL